jgi:hypothetical protein
MKKLTAILLVAAILPLTRVFAEGDTLKDIVAPSDLSQVVTARIGVSYASVYNTHETDGDVVEFILEVLENNTDSEVSYGYFSDDESEAPDIWSDNVVMTGDNEPLRLWFYGTGETAQIFTLNIGEDKDGDTYIGDDGWKPWAVKLNENKDAYKIVSSFYDPDLIEWRDDFDGDGSGNNEDTADMGSNSNPVTGTGFALTPALVAAAATAAVTAAAKTKKKGYITFLKR